MRAVLAHCGAKVSVAATARAALEALDQGRFDVLISDMAILEDDGYNLIRKVMARAERDGRIPALALTAYARIEDRAAAISYSSTRLGRSNRSNWGRPSQPGLAGRGGRTRADEKDRAEAPRRCAVGAARRLLL